MNHYVILVMNISTPAIVLHCSRLTDKTSVLHLFTRESGRVSYYLYGATSKRNMRNALLMPLALLDIEAVHQENREIQQLKEWRLAYVANTTADDIRRQSVAMFIAEILYRTLVHPLPDSALFDLLTETILALNTRDDPQNVHLEFLYAFIDSLGFGIDMNRQENQVFAPLFSQQVISQQQRRTMLRQFMTYYETHLPDFRLPKSLEVMIEVFN